VTDSTVEELQRLYDLDYGDRVEFGVRVASIVTASVLYWLYTGETTAFFWLAGFALAHVLCINQLLLNIASPGPGALNWAVALSTLVLVSFLWLPAHLILHADPVLQVGGVTGVVTMFFFVLRRSDTLLRIVQSQAAVGVLTVVYVAYEVTGQIEGLFSKGCVLFCLTLLAAYYVIALLKSRDLRLTAERAAMKTAQEQKLASIGRLAGGVAHDFNNALTGISGNLELYFELEDQREREELLRVAQQSAHRAAELVNQLLVFSRKSGITRHRIPVHTLIDEATRFEQRLLPANITIRSMSERGLIVDVDKSLFVTALINLSVNAVDAMPDGGTLSITAKRLLSRQPIACVDGRILSAGRYAEVAVTDTGTGIPPEILPRVVEPFFTTKPVGKGSGLGLSMAIGLAQSLEGGVLIETGPQGTKVSILVPDSILIRPVLEESDTAA
jgi:signal transduction histidine kinase